MLFLFNKVLPYLSALFLGLTFLIWSIQPEWTWYIAGVSGIVVISTIWSLTYGSNQHIGFWSFLSTPLLLIAGGVSFYLMVDNEVVRNIYAVFLVILYALMLKNIFSFLHQTEHYQPYALENIYVYVNMVTLFLFYSSFYGIVIFLGWPFWPLSIAVFFLSGFLFMRTLWSFKIPWQESKLFIGIISLVLAEASLVISFLPTSYSFSGLLLATMYYLMMNVMKDHLNNTMSNEKMKKYILISIIVAVITAATAKWS